MISYGTAADIESLPTPASTVNIASSTNASPTVITTSSAHGLQTGGAAIINGHLVNTNANGIWIVTVVSSTTFKISPFAGFPGTFVNGNGVGAATGTVQSLALPGVTLPEDLVNDIDAAAWNIPVEGLHDMVQWIAYRILAKMTILAGGTFTTAAGSASTFNGTLGATGAALLNGPVTINGAAEATDDFEISGTAYLSNLTRFRDPVRPSDANQTISTASGDVYLLAIPGAVRTIKLQTTTAPVPRAGERLLVVCPPGAGAGHNFTVEREDGTDIMQLHDPGSWVLCQFEGGVWRGLCYSGVNNVAGAGY